MFSSGKKRVPPQMIITPRYRTTHSEYVVPTSERNTDSKKKENASSLQIMQQIGKGKFSKVMLAIKNGEKFALKVIDKFSIIKTKTQQHIQREIAIMKLIDHPNIVKLIKEFADETNVYLLQEYCNQGSIFNKKFEQPQVKSIIRELLAALKYLHENGIMHRDIKPENIYLHNNHVKLGDFGIAQYTRVKRMSFCGTLDYMSPEIITQQYYDEKVDIWSVGILAYELSTQQPPIQDRDPNIQMRKICYDKIIYPTNFDKGLQNFIEKCLTKQSDQRATIEELLNSEYLN